MVIHLKHKYSGCFRVVVFSMFSMFYCVLNNITFKIFLKEHTIIEI